LDTKSQRLSRRWTLESELSVMEEKREVPTSLALRLP
jgi:hypothetical protein